MNLPVEVELFVAVLLREVKTGTALHMSTASYWTDNRAA